MSTHLPGFQSFLRFLMSYFWFVFQGSYTVNGVDVVEANLPATNGIIHLIAAPLLSPIALQPQVSQHTLKIQH